VQCPNLLAKIGGPSNNKAVNKSMPLSVFGRAMRAGIFFTRAVATMNFAGPWHRLRSRETPPGFCRTDVETG
jgi:hypothetical protein